MIIGGNHSQYLATALRGLEAQRQAFEHNIANVETPDFRARRVSFEDSLRQAVSRDDPSLASMSTSLSDAPLRIDGSNVILEDEVTGLELNSLRQQLVTQAINARYTRLRSTIGR